MVFVVVFVVVVVDGPGGGDEPDIAVDSLVSVVTGAGAGGISGALEGGARKEAPAALTFALLGDAALGGGVGGVDAVTVALGTGLSSVTDAALADGAEDAWGTGSPTIGSSMGLAGATAVGDCVVSSNLPVTRTAGTTTTVASKACKVAIRPAC